MSKKLAYVLTFLLNAKSFAATKVFKFGNESVQKCNNEIKAIIVQENELLRALQSQEISEDQIDGSLFISRDLYKQLNESGKIKNIKSLDTTNCGETDCTVK